MIDKRYEEVIRKQNESVEVFRDTLKQIKEKYPINEVPVKFYNNELKALCCVNEVPITLVRGGTVSTGYKYAEHERVAILNFADAMKYGGWVENGAQTQEENICRCTNLHPILGKNECDLNYYLPNKEHVASIGYEVYTNRIIYAEGVTVFKDDVTYANIEPRKLDVITCPAPREHLKEEYALALYKSRIEQIVLSAVENEADCIVLGAWGCGAFMQDPKLVARAFAEVLNKYSGYFKDIVFAIKSTPTWGEDGAYEVFRKVLKKRYVAGKVVENE